MQNTCIQCRQNTVSVDKRTEQHRTNDGVIVSFQEFFSACSTCGHEFYTYDQSIANSRAITKAVAKKSAIISPIEIKRLRAGFGLTQEDFEKALGVGKKTVARWEKGTVPPSGAANSLLWIAKRFPLVFSRLAESRAVNLTPRKACATPTATERNFVCGDTSFGAPVLVMAEQRVLYMVKGKESNNTVRVDLPIGVGS